MVSLKTMDLTIDLSSTVSNQKHFLFRMFFYILTKDNFRLKITYYLRDRGWMALYENVLSIFFTSGILSIQCGGGYATSCPLDR